MRIRIGKPLTIPAQRYEDKEGDPGRIAPLDLSAAFKPEASFVAG